MESNKYLGRNLIFCVKYLNEMLTGERVYHVVYFDFRGLFQILSGLIRKIVPFIYVKYRDYELN